MQNCIFHLKHKTWEGKDAIQKGLFSHYVMTAGKVLPQTFNLFLKLSFSQIRSVKEALIIKGK